MRKNIIPYEENPFEKSNGAREWIAAVEGERDGIRDKEIYPLLWGISNALKPTTVLEIGSGQGACSAHVDITRGSYLGVEPSLSLLQRAHELYGSEKRTFVQGNAYDLPVPSMHFDWVFSVTVWFHLAKLAQASRELARVLKPNGRFLIITANPDAYDVWETFYETPNKAGKLTQGKVRILLNPSEKENAHRYASLSENTFYRHSRSHILGSLSRSGLTIDRIRPLGYLPISQEKNLFIAIEGYR